MIIESKLASVPESFIESRNANVKVTQEPAKTETKKADETEPKPSPSEAEPVAAGLDETDVENVNTEEPSETVKGVKVSEDARYKKYFKMLQFGVPAPAVKLKMAAEGVDGTLLE